MIQPRDHLAHGLDRTLIGWRGPAQHYDVYTQRARRRDLAVGRAPATVLGDHRIDSMRAHKRLIMGRAERTTIGDIADARQRQRRFDGVDAADQIKVLRRRDERRELGAAERNKDPARSFSQSAHRISDIDCFDPTVTRNSAPWRPAKHNQRHARLVGGSAGICRNDIGVGMRRVDQSVDAFLANILGKTGGAAEAAAANRHRLWRRRLGAAGQRCDDFEIRAFRQPLGQFSRFGRAAEDKDA